MSEAASESRTNAAEYTVSEISGALKRTVEDVFGNVRVRGEISGYRGPHSSGHAYFALKDDRARLDAVVWKGTMSRLKFRPEEGMEVIATGKLTTYPGKSNYQIVIDNLEPAGAGALMALLEERKRRLQAEGLFDTGRKRLLPFMPRVIGVVTSPTGSVIRDIIHRIKDRFPLHVLVWPVRVQGETSGAEVTAAVNGFNALAWDGAIQRPDLLIVARGGGSLEDLWGFNDEALARAVAASGIPVISAVGHETDWTLIDLVADVRAPTPTGAAEIAVPVKADLEATLASLGARLKAAVLRNFERKRQAARAAARALPSPDQLLALPRRRLDEATSRLGRGLLVSTERKRARFFAVKLTPAMLSQRIAEARRTNERNLLRAQGALRAMARARRAELNRAADQLPKCARASLQRHKQQLAMLQGRITIEPTARRQRVQRDLLTALTRRGTQAVVLRLERLRGRVVQADRLMASLSHKAVLARGFALVRDADGAVVKQAADVVSGMALSLEFADGTADAVAISGTAKPKAVAKPAAKAKEPGNQGSLF
ncbi:MULTISPECIES: exodeoxyribonuclease VII large subunit [unclassified Mesorhizobium]|uniref:exodeoxyribonuclease VII large subunit n=1 Tax=unclassified Mesorhizobium TaxID=325217 RepID=UPI000FCB393D|nr:MULTISPECIES: exodeoxyribonuclease VII large subunit [unclassified Mesorhizobium]RUX78661.1 exodeoxyribonuclease VII large subunit [Mesorhizobium sp. M7A.F.Ca.US.005.03.1.1]RUY25482.1 exodeoxyribonuclease VII large subunit [Mesorhizobium sp. M7A.F.Ca.US.001.04.2.1]RUY42017.1 exodeoxyribonuclease VII large subunit [Mesorhizobium sp. M7A.F.Ca.US.001.04.1.1]RUY89267.1 exodeoxyribonuclease VII large subunit [Mesorhizobium sp. M7A.F.Ca.CA.001.12.2.1]RUZ22400.1 exodeoxyribonuclease VII large subu